MNGFELDNLRKELAPFLNRLACAGEADARQQDTMRVGLLRFQDALIEAYEPGRVVPLRSYLARNLARFAYALAEALRPEPTANETSPAARKQFFAGTLPVGGQHERPDLGGVDGLAQLERWPNCLSLPEAVTRLEELLRAVFVGHYYEGRSFDEIAARLNLPVSGIGKLFEAALERLSDELARLPLALK